MDGSKVNILTSILVCLSDWKHFEVMRAKKSVENKVFMFLSSSPLRIKQITRLFVANKRLVIGAANFTSKTIKIVQK